MMMIVWTFALLATIARCVRSAGRVANRGKGLADSDVDDIVAETAVRCLAAQASYNPDMGTPEAWACTVARNVLKDHFKALKYRACASLDAPANADSDAPPWGATLPDPIPSPERVAIARDNLRQARCDAYQRSEADGRMFDAMAEEGGDLDDTSYAQKVGAAHGMVRVRKARLRKALSEEAR